MDVFLQALQFCLAHAGADRFHHLGMRDRRDRHGLSHERHLFGCLDLAQRVEVGVRE